MSFAIRLRTARERKGLSLQKLADAVGVSKAYLWELETERATNPSLELLGKLSTKLDASIATLVGENPNELPAEDESVVMFRDIQKLSEIDRETIKLMMERLKK